MRMSRIAPWLVAQGVLVAAAWASYGPAERKSEGIALYRTHCAVCHGETGRGDGPGSPLNVPRPRDFATGQFRLISSKRKVPTREDLFETITRGIPGTGMPPWGHLSEEQRWALADTVLDLTKEGVARQLSGTPEETRIEAEKRLKAERYVAPPMPPSTPERLAHGRLLFVDACVSCHGETGRGLRDAGWKTAEGEGLGSRDLVAGTFKGGEEPEDLFRRIQFGIPGTPMSALEMDDPNDVWDLVHYTKSLRRIPPEQAPLAPVWMPEAMNEQARMIDHDFHLTIWVTGAVGLCALGGLVAGLLRFRLKGAGVVPFRPGDRRVFIAWIAIPTLIVLVMIVNSWQVYRKLMAPWPDALKVHVTAKQFFWRFDLPALGAQSTGEIAVPAGRPVHFELDSVDVIHSFFLPHLRMKRDVVPGMTTHLWMAPLSKPGTYPILCNQLCGDNHAIMNATLRVLEPADFERWVALRKP